MKCIIFTVYMIGATIAATSDSNNVFICRKVSPEAKDGSPIISETASDFKSLISDSDLFIDNSLLIKEILEIPKPVVKITCPESWGKSINLKMFAGFVAIRFSGGGIIKPVNKTENYEIFVKGELKDPFTNITHKLEHPFAISKHHEIIDEYLAKYPVLLVDFSAFKPTSFTYEEFLYYFKHVIGKVYRLYGFIERKLKAELQSKGETESEELKQLIRRFKLYRAEEERTEEKLAGSIAFLCQLLYRVYETNTIVVIDDYDKVVHTSYSLDGVSEKVVHKIMTFYYSFMSQTFKQNDNLKKGVVTGVQNIALGNEQDGLDLITSYHDIIQPGMLPQYGFTESQVDELFAIYNVPKNLAVEAKQWYGGYKVSDLPQTRYTPRSIVKFLTHRTLDNYRPLNESMGLFVHAAGPEDVRNVFLSLVDRKNVTFVPKKLLSYDDIIILKHSLCGLTIIDLSCRIEVLLTYLYAIGYLTSESSSKQQEKHVVIPNREVEALWHELMEECHKEG